MLRPFLVAVRPDDWLGKIALFATRILLAVLLIAILLARLPESWVELAFDRPLLVRVLLLPIALWLVAWVRAIVYSRLPKGVWLLGRRLAVPQQGGKRKLKLEEIAGIAVEVRPSPRGETFVIDLRDGSKLDLCPVAWQNAPRLYSVLARKLKRRAA